MAIDEQKNALGGSTSELQSDHNFFSNETQESDSIDDTVKKPSVITHPSPQVLNRNALFTFSQKFLTISIITVASILVYSVVKSLKETSASSPPKSPIHRVPSVQQISRSQPPATEPPRVREEQTQKQKLKLSSTQPISLELADNFYIREEYDKAYDVYDLLRQALPASDQLLSDFFRMKMALCANEATDFERASQMLTAVSHSRSPVVRIMANYHLCLLEMQRKRYLRAITRAYNAMALIKAVDFDDDWVQAFESDCHFLIAECLTRHILSFTDTGTKHPDDLWASSTISSSPFNNLGGIKLRKFVNSGSEHLSEALLEPTIQNLKYTNQSPRWSVTSYGAPLEELMAKFAVNAGIDLHWTSKGNENSSSGEEAIRQRSVTLHLPAATSHEFVLIAAGCAGLMAHIEDKPDKLKVTIYDPTHYTSLNEYLSLLSQQAVSLWQRFTLMYYSDERLADAHFTMGLLQSHIGRLAEAIAEYKFVAGRFSQTSLAPFALLNSSKIRTSLHDYQGAREDLKQLVEQYPDTVIYEQAYLLLADATMEEGLNEEAARLYQRLHNFGFSSGSKTVSALRAARCLYEVKAYEEVIQWLMRYIDLARDDNRHNVYSAYFLLGRTHLALRKYQEACDAFQCALLKGSSREQNIEATVALVQCHIEQEHFVEALDALENIHWVTLSQVQSVEMLLLRSRIFRVLGLVDKAIISLREMTGYVSDTQLNMRISFELAQCHMAKGDFERARGLLSEILRGVEPGPVAQEAALALADACIKLNDVTQAVSVCLQLLGSNLPPEKKQQTLRTLAAAYKEQKEYNKSALTFSGQWK